MFSTLSCGVGALQISIIVIIIYSDSTKNHSICYAFWQAPAKASNATPKCIYHMWQCCLNESRSNRCCTIETAVMHVAPTEWIWHALAQCVRFPVDVWVSHSNPHCVSCYLTTCQSTKRSHPGEAKVDKSQIKLWQLDKSSVCIISKKALFKKSSKWSNDLTMAVPSKKHA